MYTILFILILGFILTSVGIILEKKSFHHGTCPHCKTLLKCFDTDSQGGRGYVCKNCNYTTWVSYRCVDKNFN